MRRSLLVVIIIFVIITSGKSLRGEDSYFPVQIKIESEKDIYRLSELRINIDDVDREEGYVIAYVEPQELDDLKKRGYEVNRIEDKAHEAWEYYSSLEDMGPYHSYAEVGNFVHRIDSAYSIARLETLGTSVEGRYIWALEITDNPDIDEPEPEFCYYGPMHGDEPPGMEFLINLTNLLVENYGTDSTYTQIVNETELWFVFSQNPDGYIDGSRENSNSVDLNRNFPVPDGSKGYDGTYSLEPETECIMDFSKQRNFCIASNFHTGALVVNYPWDYKEERSPDDSILIDIALDYSRENRYLWGSSEFDNGITNGYDWYPVNGSLQDWAHWKRSQLHFTVEFCRVKWPDSSKVDSIWRNHKPCMISMIQWSQKGVRGLITDSITAEPLRAQVEVIEIGHPIYSDSAAGDYHRILRPGTYTLEFSKPGYYTKTISDVEVDDTAATHLDVELVSKEGTIRGFVDLFEDSLDDGAIVSLFKDTLVYKDTTDETGYYNLEGIIPDSNYTIMASKVGWADSTLAISAVEARETDTINFTLYPIEVFYFNDLEGDSARFDFTSLAGGPFYNDWEFGSPSDVGPDSAHSGEKCWATELDQKYSDSSQSILLLKNIDLTDLDGPFLTFYHWYKFQPLLSGAYHDGGNLKVIAGNDTTLIYPEDGYPDTLSEWNKLIPYQSAFVGSLEYWHKTKFDLSPFSEDTIDIGWYFGSSNQNTEMGWYIDDIALKYEDRTLIVDESAPRGEKKINVRVTPNPFHENTNITFSIQEKKEIVITILDAKGRVVKRVRKRSLDAGSHTVSYKFSNLASGIYFCKFKTPQKSNLIKMIHLK